MRSASRAFGGRIKNNGTQSKLKLKRKRKLTPKALQQIATAALTFDDSPPVLTLPLYLPLPPSLSVPLSHSLSLTPFLSLFSLCYKHTHTLSLSFVLFCLTFTQNPLVQTHARTLLIYFNFCPRLTHTNTFITHIIFIFPFFLSLSYYWDKYSIFLLLSFYILRQSKIFFL